MGKNRNGELGNSTGLHALSPKITDYLWLSAGIAKRRSRSLHGAQVHGAGGTALTHSSLKPSDTQNRNSFAQTESRTTQDQEHRKGSEHKID